MEKFMNICGNATKRKYRNKHKQGTKVCSKCNTEYEGNLFYFFRASKRHEDGFNSTCKLCLRRKESKNPKAVKNLVDYYMLGITPQDY